MPYCAMAIKASPYFVIVHFLFLLSLAFSKKSMGRGIRAFVAPFFRPPLIIDILCSQLLLQVLAISLETLQAFFATWSEDVHVVWT